MASELSRLAKPAGATTKGVRVGRGVGSGIGKTSGRGQKGQYARAGSFKRHFEGGQTPLQRRLPKRGFKPLDKQEYAEINVGSLDRFPAGSNVDVRALRECGLIKGKDVRVKVLGDGELKMAITVTADAFSKEAARKIGEAGGRVVLTSQAV